MENFRYHSFAVGLSGHIEQPFDEVLPVQASVALPQNGGFGTARVERFRFRNIISADYITSVVAGSHSRKDGTYDSLATVIIEKLDVLGVLTADRIVARIAAIHPEDGGPPSITPVGSHFDNLRIAGHRIEVDLATDTFSRLDTAGKVRQAYRDNDAGFREEFDDLSIFGNGEGGSIPERNGEMRCALVREIAGLGSGLVRNGHTVRVRGFGVIRLAEFRIAESLRSLNMLQIDLGSTPSGTVGGGGVEGNGSGW